MTLKEAGQAEPHIRDTWGPGAHPASRDPEVPMGQTRRPGSRHANGPSRTPILLGSPTGLKMREGIQEECP